jgi:hypothetical protein
MLIREEVLEKLYNSKETFIKPLVRLGILKYKSHIQSKLNPRDVWARFKFNFYNPLTYIYLIPAIIIGTPIGLLNSSLKQVWRDGKKELTEGIELFLN